MSQLGKILKSVGKLQVRGRLEAYILVTDVLLGLLLCLFKRSAFEIPPTEHSEEKDKECMDVIEGPCRGGLRQKQYKHAE